MFLESLVQDLNRIWYTWGRHENNVGFVCCYYNKKTEKKNKWVSWYIAWSTRHISFL